MPDSRQFLTKVSGTPYPVEKFATEALDAVERDEGIIVIPARARMMWRAYRLAPGLTDSVSARMMAEARRTKPR